MKFRSGETIENRTRKYLAHILSDESFFPKYLTTYLFNNHVGIFRGDLQFDRAMANKNKYLLFVVVDINGPWVEKLNRYKSIESGRKQYRDFLRQWEAKKIGTYKVWDYVIDDLHRSNHHVFVLDISKYRDAVDAWDKGQYSHMFTEEELKKYGIHKTRGGQLSSLYATFKKLPEAKNLFKQRIEREFGTIISDVDVDELDIPPLKREEILNYKNAKS